MSSAEKALRILSLLDRGRPVLRVGEVCRALDLPKSSASRLLKTISESGLLMREPGGTGYIAGPRCLALSDLYLAQHRLLELIERGTNSLVQEFGFVSYICALEGRDLLILRRRHGSYPLRLMRDVGLRMPAIQGAAGRALLARLPERQALALVREDPQWTARADEVRAELDAVRQAGVVMTVSTGTPGVAATAAAVADPTHGELLAFSVSFPIAATDHAARVRIAQRVWEVAAEIGARLDDAYWTERGRAPPPLDFPDLNSIVPLSQDRAHGGERRRTACA